MGTFNTQTILNGNPMLIPSIADKMVQSFKAEGFEVLSTSTLSGGYDISITKGGTFKSILGMKSALKILLSPRNGNIFFEASVGIFGQQAIPTIISMFFFWPVLITQLWGLIRQSKLDDKALAIAQEYIDTHRGASPSNTHGGGTIFCSHCGKQIAAGSRFCSYCGGQL